MDIGLTAVPNFTTPNEYALFLRLVNSWIWRLIMIVVDFLVSAQIIRGTQVFRNPGCQTPSRKDVGSLSLSEGVNSFACLPVSKHNKLMLWGCTKRSRNMIWLRRCWDTGHYLRKMLICIDLLGMRQPTILSCLVGTTVKHAIFVQQDFGVVWKSQIQWLISSTLKLFFWWTPHCSQCLMVKFHDFYPIRNIMRLQETQETLVITPKVKNCQKVWEDFFLHPIPLQFPYYSLVKPPFFTFGGKIPFHDRYILMISTIFYHDFPQYFLYPSIATY